MKSSRKTLIEGSDLVYDVKILQGNGRQQARLCRCSLIPSVDPCLPRRLPAYDGALYVAQCVKACGLD
jgi:hypothetical protein